jgi:hypothetical protein
MNPNEQTPKPDRSDEPEAARTNGTNGPWPIDPFAGLPGPSPIRLSEEELARIRDEVSEEEIVALLREMERTGGLTSEEFFRGLEEAAGGNV